ncbi:MAG: prepilin peptidase [Gammaproteobacteria bacterium]|nr:prepilin peptidase [Gammaproteobacteria bacterium]MCP5135558.1 prepilin peptidase [Gammaproteobacteria bacterium]
MPIMVLVAFSTVLLMAAVTDVLRFRIPNTLIMVLLIMYPAWVLVSPVDQPWLMSLAVFTLTLLLALVAFRFGVLGAGDGKLLATVLLWAGPHHATEVLLVAAVTGGVLALIYGTNARFALANTLERIGTPKLRDNLLAERLPYGVAIAVGGIAFAVGVIRLYPA